MLRGEFHVVFYMTRYVFSTMDGIGLKMSSFMSQIEAHFFTQLAFTTMKLLKVIAGIHNEKNHIYWTGEYSEFKCILLNMKQCSGPIGSEHDEQITYIQKSISSINTR